MKRCPTCNRTFEEDWLAFCTQDGTTLIEDSPARADEPPPTILSAPPPPPAGDWRQPSGGLGAGQFQSQPIPPPVPPSNLGGPSGGFGSGQFQPQQQMQSGWQPPPPPPYAQGPKQGHGRQPFPGREPLAGPEVFLPDAIAMGRASRRSACAMPCMAIMAGCKSRFARSSA